MILTINRAQIEHGVEVLPMNGRIVPGNDARSVEWKFEELLKGVICDTVAYLARFSRAGFKSCFRP